MAESGIFYSTFIDPLLTSLRKNVLNQIKEGESVIDIACGTGAQVLECSKKASMVLGIDLSESMVKFAEKQAYRRKITNVKFMVADATVLHDISEEPFDSAILSMALHQFEPGIISKVLGECKHVAEKIIIVDYAIPLPGNIIGAGCRFAEFLAGGEHLQNFKWYRKKGGMLPILAENKLDIQHEKLIGNKAFHLVVCSK